MIRKEDRTGGRRPLLVTFVGNNRQMLNEIRDSLSHLRKNELELCNDLSGLHLKPELSQSTSNLPDKSTGSKMTRRDNQHHKTLAEIRDSLRPYQTATNSNGPMSIGVCGSSSNGAGSGGGGGSDSSSTTSSSSSHTTGDPDVNQNMVQDITRHGFDVDIAVKALKLSGNQSADAALRLLSHIVNKLNEVRHPSGISNYQHMNHRSGFIPTSPVTSDTASIRSDSPSLNPPRHLVVNGTQPPPPLPPRVPITTTQSNNTPRGQTPPPSATGLDGSMKSSSLIAQQSLPSQGTNISVSSQAINAKNKVPSQPGLLAQSPMFDQSADIPQGLVKQLIQRMNPLQPYYQLHAKQKPQPQSPHSQSNGGVVGTTIVSNRGVSPVQQQPIIMGTSSTSSTPTPSPLLIQNMFLNAQGVSATSSSSPSPAPSSNGSPSLQNSFPQGPPPPYSQAQAQIQAARYGVACHIEQHQELNRPTPMSVNPDSQQQQQMQKRLVANKAVSATRRPMDSSHQPVIMHSVKSKEVQKPMPQTATTPVIPPTQNVNGNSIASSVTPGFVSPVSAHPSTLAGQQQLRQQQSALSAAFSASPNPRSAMSAKRDVNAISHSQTPYHHQNLLRNGPVSNYTPEQFAAVAAASTGQPTILTTRIRQSPLTHQNHHPNLKYSQYQEAQMSTPRSDSPVSRATNQSPLSVLSTTSSPSTNSDIPEKLPPPYPGRIIGQPPHMNPPLLPPRIPINTKPPTPPPPNEQQDQLHINMQLTNSSKLPPSHLPSTFPPVSSSSSSSSPSPSSPGNLIMGNGPSPQVPIPGPRSTPMAQPSSMPTNLQQTDTSNPRGLTLVGARPSPAPTNGPSSETEETDTDTSSVSQGLNSSSNNNNLTPPPKGSSNNQEKHRCMSPLPERKSEARERDKLRCDTKVRNYSPQAFKFFMEQHVENLLKSHSQRVNRKMQLEKEMAKAKLSDEAAQQMRKMLHQKESNYIRLKRAKMDSSMFEKINTLGVGAFGEVALVRKKDVNQLYAMKTLQKTNVIQRNQVAHVKAERDILAEADNEWVVKLYYSFQDRDNLYFVMDYVPGGDLMGLLIRKEILEESLARFYIAELVLAIESVHRMGFIHRDIKPDNILIDQDGHIKLTDFGLCTGFRWTHNSKYYQKDGSHARQDSMEVNLCQFDEQCRCEIVKPLEQRRQREQKRCLAHSLVGTPNYIAPEVLQRQGYTKACDWWSVGVILYEMVIGSPPFYASTPAETQYKVINWKETLTIRHDANISSSTSDLIFKLLRDAESRLGKHGASQVKQHPFFHGINFEGLRRQPAPYKPVIRSRTDTSNFDPVDPDKLQTNDSENSKKVDSKLENGKHPEHAFYEFTFRRFFDDGGPSSLPPQLDQEANSPVFV